MAEKFDIFTIKSNNIAPKAGKILIAEPFLPDIYFNRSVILLVEHNEEGSLGIVMNKPSKEFVSDAIEDFPDFKGKLYLGGPVSTDRLFFIHSRPDLFDESYHIMENLYWGSSMKDLKDLIMLGLINAEEVRIFVGYSGWNENQLNEEIKNNTWLISSMGVPTLMNTKAEELWSKSVKTLGNKYRLWLNFPDNPEMN
jgi:putative transcriptional regulator